MTDGSEINRIETGSLHWVRLLAGNGLVTSAQLTNFAEAVRANIPGAVIRLDEFGLRAEAWHGKGGPRPNWEERRPGDHP